MMLKSTRNGVIGFEGVTLMPGTNEIKNDVWAKMKDHPTMKQLITDGTLEVVGKETDDHLDINTLSQNDAKKLVSDSTSLPLLETFLKEEKRAVVRKDIDDQIKKLKAAPQYRESATSSNAQ